MTEEEKQRKEVDFSFLLIGLSSLLPWNTILSQLDLFMHYQKEYHPELVFGNINFCINLTLQFILLTTKKRFAYKTLFLFSLCGFMISLISLPIATIYFPADLGFKISCFSVFLTGFSNAIIQSSMFALVSYFPLKNVISLGAGQSLSGIVMTIIRYDILLLVNEKDGLNFGAYLFFGISSCIILFVVRQIFVVYKNPTFLLVLEQIGEIKKEGEENKGNKLIDDKDKEDIELEDIGEGKKEKVEKKEKGLLFLIMKILDINIMIMLCYTVTIGLFPGACIKPSLFSLTPGWKINTIIFLYNFFDTVGRKLVGYIKKPSKGQLITITIIRTLFIFTFPLVIYLEKYNILSINVIGVLSILNTSLMSLTNGIANNLCFSLAPEQVEGELKAKAGSSVSLFLAVGLFLGSFFANIMDSFVNNL